MKWPEFFAKQLPVEATESRDLNAVQKTLDAYLSAREPRQRVRDEIFGELGDPDPEMPETATQTEHRRRVLADIKVLQKGEWSSGFSDRRLAPFVGGPGIDHLTHWIGRCREVIRRENELREKHWPAPFRYVGAPGTMHLDGRLLRRGDVAMLSREQADAWADKFQPVEQEQPAEATS